MATLGHNPDGLVARDDLPRARPMAVSVWWRRGLPTELARGATRSLQRLLALSPDPTVHIARSA